MAITPEEAKKIQDAFGTPVLAKVDYSGVPTVDTQKKLDPTELKSQWAKLPYDARDEMMRKAMKNGDTYILGSYPQDERDWQKFSGLKLEDSFIKNTPKFQDTTLSQGRVIDKKAIEDQLQNEKDPLRRAELETTLELAPKELDPYAQIMKAEDAIKTNERLAQKKANEYANGVDYLVRMRANTPTEGPTNVFNEFYKGFARASQQAGGAVFGALEMLSENDPYMTWLNDYAQTQADNARSSILKSPELNRSSSTKNFTDGGYADPNYYANVLGSLLPHIAGALTASVAGASVGGGVGAVAGASAYSFSMESGSLYNDLLDSGYSMDEARSASLKYGAVASVLDSIIPAKVGGAVANTFTQGLLRQGVKQSVKQTIGKMVKEFGKDVLIEASTEATQEFAQNVTKRYFDKNQDIWENVVDSFVGGALGGGVFGAVGMGTQSVDNKTATVPEEMRNYSAENGYQGKDMQNMASQKVTPDVSNRLSSIVKSATTNESAKKGFSQLTEVEDGISASIRLAEIMKAKDPTDKVVQDIQDQAQQELNKVKVQKQILAKQYEEGTNVDVVASPEFTMSVGETIDGKFISSADLMLETGTEMLDNPTKYDTRAEAELGMTNLVQEYIGDKLSNEEMDQVDIERLQSVNSTLLGFVQKPNPQRMIRENRDVMLLAQDMKDYGRFEKAVRSNNLLPEGTDLAKFYERAQSKEGMYVTAREARGVVEKYAKDMGVSTEFVDRITTPEGKQALGSFMRDKRVIKLVTRGEEGMPDVEITTPYHEVGHAYFQTMMTPQERADVLQEIKNSRKKEMTDKQAEEILVEDLRAYNDKKTLKALKKTIQPAYARLLDSIKEIVDKVLKWVSRSSEDKINQFYEDVLSMKRPSEKVAMERAGKEEVYRETPEDLSNEALKYDTVEAFIEDVFSSPSYGMGHRPAWEDMPPASNLLEGGIIPSDVYEKPEWSIASGRNMRTDAAAKESFSALLQVRDKPEMEVTIYRSSPKNELHIGDWVSLSKTYAKEEGSAENSPVFSYKVKAKDVIFAGDDINEFGYYPKQMLVDIYNKAHEGENKQIFDTMVEKNTSFREEWRDGHSSPSASFDSVEDRMNDGGDFSLKEVAKGFHTQPKDYFDEKVGARYYMYNDKEGMESATVINNVQRRVISGKENITVKAYRAIPNYIQNTSLINYDWVSLSKSYAINHGESRFGDGEYHIIEQDVAIENLWWDGNDIREWGYDTTTQEEFDAESFREAPSSLEEEAKKYKSAEEFANAQIKNYHGTKDNFDVFDTTKTKGAGFYFTRDKEAASSFAKQSGGNIVKENYIFLKNPAPKDAVIEAFSSANAKGKDFKEMTTSVSKQVRDNLISKGYDGYYGEVLPSGNGYAETVVFDPSSIKTKQQLTDIYNKAHGESFRESSVKTIYHGTNDAFSQFDVDQTMDGTVWFTDSKESITSGSSGAVGTKYIMERTLDESKLKLATWDEYDRYSTQELIEMGYDGVKLEDGNETSYSIFYPEKLGINESFRENDTDETSLYKIRGDGDIIKGEDEISVDYGIAEELGLVEKQDMDVLFPADSTRVKVKDYAPELVGKKASMYSNVFNSDYFPKTEVATSKDTAWTIPEKEEVKKSVDDALYEVSAQVDVAQAGMRIGVEDGTVSFDSTFPQWVSQDNRSKELLTRASEYLDGRFRIPPKNSPRLRSAVLDLYTEVARLSDGAMNIQEIEDSFDKVVVKPIKKRLKYAVFATPITAEDLQMVQEISDNVAKYSEVYSVEEANDAITFLKEAYQRERELLSRTGSPFPVEVAQQLQAVEEYALAGIEDAITAETRVLARNTPNVDVALLIPSDIIKNSQNVDEMVAQAREYNPDLGAKLYEMDRAELERLYTSMQSIGTSRPISRLETVSDRLEKNIQAEKARNEAIVSRLTDARIKMVQMREARAYKQTERNRVRNVARMINLVDRKRIKDLENEVKMSDKQYLKDIYKAQAKGANAAALETTRILKKKSREIAKYKEMLGKVESLRKRVKESTRTGGRYYVDFARKLLAVFDEYDTSSLSNRSMEKLQDIYEMMYNNEKMSDEMKEWYKKNIERVSKKSLRDMTYDELAELYDMLSSLANKGAFELAQVQYFSEEEKQRRIALAIESTKNMDGSGRKGTTRTELSEGAFKEALIRTGLDVLTPVAVMDKFDGAKNFTGWNAMQVRSLQKGEQMWYAQLHGATEELKTRIQEIKSTFTKNEEIFLSLIARSREEADGAVNNLLLQLGITDGVIPAQIEGLTIEQAEQIIDIIEDIAQKYEISTQLKTIFEARTNKPFPLKKHYIAPLKYANIITDTTDADIEAMQNMADYGTEVGEGMAISRMEKVDLEVRTDLLTLVTEGWNHSLYYINMQPRVDNIQSVVGSQEFKAHAGRIVSKYWKEYLSQVANKGKSMGQGTFDVILRNLRQNFQVAILGFKATTVLLQPTAGFNAVMSAYAMHGTDVALSIMGELAQAYIVPSYKANALSQSEALTLRAGSAGSTDFAEINRLMETGLADLRGNYSKVKAGAIKASMYMIQEVDIRTASAVRQGMYKALIARGVPEAKASADADFFMSLSQSSTQLVDRPLILSRYGEFGRLFFTFQTFTLGLWSMITQGLVVNGIIKGTPQVKMKSALALLAIPFFTAFAGEMISIVNNAIKGKDDDEDIEDKLKNALENTWIELVATIPLFGSIVKGKILYNRNYEVPVVGTFLDALEGVQGLMSAEDYEDFITKFVDTSKATAIIAGLPGAFQAGDLINRLIVTEKEKKQIETRATARAYMDAKEVNLDKYVTDLIMKLYTKEEIKNLKSTTKSSLKTNILKEVVRLGKNDEAKNVLKLSKNEEKADYLKEIRDQYTPAEFKQLVNYLKKYKVLSDDAELLIYKK